MKYDVLLSDGANEFIEELDIKMRAKTMRTIGLLEEFGPLLSEPHTRKIKGIKGLFELRIKLSNNIVRLFYFHIRDRIYIITSGYIKKDNKLKKSEIEKAVKIMTEIKEKFNNETS
ncbi:MAG: type II toxin-antitoxin system RelE/ParE family toxin [Spirochaetia bacterium]|nr:type II toxin-antitoxin system RelE/ParE family toxin [Spirochaetia bacterium]